MFQMPGVIFIPRRHCLKTVFGWATTGRQQTAPRLEAFHPRHQVRLGLDRPVTADDPACDVPDQPVELARDVLGISILVLRFDGTPQAKQSFPLGLAPSPDVGPLALVSGRRELVHEAGWRGVLVVLRIGRHRATP
jgi:hypothetical protein